MKVSIIGTGKVGGTTALLLAGNNKIDELLLINRTKKKAEGLLKDLMGSFPNLGDKLKVGEYSDANDSDIILFTCGVFAAPDGKGPYDSNKKMAHDIFALLKPNKDCKIVVISTPVDEISLEVLRLSTLDQKNVIGFGGQLDVNRLKYLIYEEIGNIVDCDFIGVHGAQGIPIFRENISDREKLVERSKNYFKLYLSRLDISIYGTASELAKLINALMTDKESKLTVSYFDEKYGMFITWPCLVNKNGVIDQINLDLTEEETKKFELLIKSRKTNN